MPVATEHKQSYQMSSISVAPILVRAATMSVRIDQCPTSHQACSLRYRPLSYRKRLMGGAVFIARFACFYKLSPMTIGFGIEWPFIYTARLCCCIAYCEVSIKK